MMPNILTIVWNADLSLWWSLEHNMAFLLCRQSGAGTRSRRQLDTALLVAEQLKRPILRMPNKEEVAAMDRLISEVASPRTRRLLADYKQEGKVC